MYASDQPVILYGGAGGGGKSHFLRWASWYHTIHVSEFAQRPCRTVLACRTYRELTDRHIHRLEDDFRPYGEVRTSQTFGLGFHFRNEDIGVILLRNLDDPDKYRGMEVVGSFVDEASTLPPEYGSDHIVDLLEYPLRANFETPSLPLVLASNPDGPGFGWLKRMFVTRTKLLEHDPADVFFIPAKVDDNPNEPARNTLKKKLARLQPHLRDARLHGLWNAPEGARFPQLGDKNIYRHRDRFPRGLPQQWPRLLSVDYGYADPYCALWHAIEPGLGKLNVFTYREDYQTGLLARDQAKRIVAKTGRDEKISALYADPSMWNRETSAVTGTMPITIASIYESELDGDPRFPPIQHGVYMTTSRIHGMNSLGDFLSHEGEIDWYIEEGCSNLLAELEGAVFARKAGTEGWSEDLDKKCRDHAITSSIYGLHTHLIAHMERPEKPEETFYDLINRQRKTSGPKRRI